MPTLPILTPSTYFPLVAPSAPLSSADINTFATTVKADIDAIAAILNDSVKPIYDKLTQLATTAGLAGTSLPVDHAASVTKDSGLFWNIATSAPASIHDSFLTMMQILANVHNGMKEGVKVGDKVTPTTVAINSTLSYAWPYTDTLFWPMLFKVSGNYVNQLPVTAQGVTTSVNAYIDTTDKTLKIKNNTGGEISIFGYIIHPVLPTYRNQ